MTRQEALEALSYHSGRNENVRDPRWENGFLGMLRPFRGRLDSRNFHEVMRCLYVLHEDLYEKALGRPLVSDLWQICHFCDVWALAPGGMLRSNALLSPEETAMLMEWKFLIAGTVCCLLADSDRESAFAEYRQAYPIVFASF